MAVQPEAEAAQTAADRALSESDLGALVVELNARIANLNREGEAIGEQIRELLARAAEINAEGRSIEWRLSSMVLRETVTSMRFYGNLL